MIHMQIQMHLQILKQITDQNTFTDMNSNSDKNQQSKRVAQQLSSFQTIEKKSAEAIQGILYFQRYGERNRFKDRRGYF